VAQRILELVGADKVAFVPHDAYYRDLSHLRRKNAKALTSIHPMRWRRPDGAAAQAATCGTRHRHSLYDFKTHTRTTKTIHIEPAPIILVEGILILAEPELRKLCNVRLFVDTDADIRLIRRLRRDIQERGRTAESVIEHT
jgi:uridine kinase